MKFLSLSKWLIEKLVFLSTGTGTFSPQVVVPDQIQLPSHIEAIRATQTSNQAYQVKDWRMPVTTRAQGESGGRWTGVGVGDGGGQS